MKTSNIVSENLRAAETGLMWEEVLTNALGTITMPRCATFRVRATGATTVTIDGVLAMTMSAGEIALFNAGSGSMKDTGNRYVSVVIGGIAAYVQVAREVDRDRKQVNTYNLLNLPTSGDQST